MLVDKELCRMPLLAPVGSCSCEVGPKSGLRAPRDGLMLFRAHGDDVVHSSSKGREAIELNAHTTIAPGKILQGICIRIVPAIYKKETIPVETYDISSPNTEYILTSSHL